MGAGEVCIGCAEDGDRRSLALLLAAVAGERDGIAAEPPVDVDELADSWVVEGTLVAVADGVIVGEVRVDPTWRGRGVGTVLVGAAIGWARGRGLHKLALSVFPDSRAAIALDRRSGFVEAGRLVRRVRRSDGQLWDLMEMGLRL